MDEPASPEYGSDVNAGKSSQLPSHGSADLPRRPALAARNRQSMMTTSSYITEATFPPSPLAVSDYEPSYNGTELTTPDLADDKKISEAFAGIEADVDSRQGLGISISDESDEPHAALSPVSEAEVETEATPSLLSRTPTLRRNTASYDLNSEIELNMHSPTTPLKLKGDAHVSRAAMSLPAVDKPLPALTPASHNRLDAHGLQYRSAISAPPASLSSPLGSRGPLKGIANKVTGLGKKLGASPKISRFGTDTRLPGTSGWSAPSIIPLRAKSNTLPAPAAAREVQPVEAPLSDDVLLRDELLGLSSAPCAVGGMIWTPMEVTLYPDSLAIGAANPEDQRQNRVMLSDMVDVLIVTMEEARIRQLPAIEQADAQTFGSENLNMVILDIGMTDGSKYLALPRARGVRWKSEIEMALAPLAASPAPNNLSTVALPNAMDLQPLPNAPDDPLAEEIRNGRLRHFEAAQTDPLTPEMVADIPFLSGSQEALHRTSIPRAESTELKMLASPDPKTCEPAADVWSSPRQGALSIGSPGPIPVPLTDLGLPEPGLQVEPAVDLETVATVEPVAEDEPTSIPDSHAAAAEDTSNSAPETSDKVADANHEPSLTAQAVSELRTMTGDVLLKLDVVAKEQAGSNSQQQRHLSEVKDLLPNVLEKCTLVHQDLMERDDASKQHFTSLLSNQSQTLEKLGNINGSLDAAAEAMESLAPLKSVPEQVRKGFEVMVAFLDGHLQDANDKYAAEIDGLKLQNEVLCKAIRAEMSSGFASLSAATESAHSAVRDHAAGAIKDHFHDIMAAQVESDKKEADALRDEINSLRAKQRELEASIGELMQTKAKYERDTEVAKDAWQQAEQVRVVADAVARRAVTEVTKAEAASRSLPSPPMPPLSPALRTVPPTPPRRPR